VIAFSPILSAAPCHHRRVFTPPPLAPAARPAQPQNVVIVYDDFAAGERAVRTLTRIRAEAGPTAQFSPVPWGFDFLAELPWRSKAIRDVDAADLIILSISQPDEIPAAINHWISTCFRRQLIASVPVVVQFADDEVWTLTPQIAAVAALARKPAPVAGPPTVAAPREIDRRPFPFRRLPAFPARQLC